MKAAKQNIKRLLIGLCCLTAFVPATSNLAEGIPEGCLQVTFLDMDCSYDRYYGCCIKIVDSPESSYCVGSGQFECWSWAVLGTRTTLWREGHSDGECTCGGGAWRQLGDPQMVSMWTAWNDDTQCYLMRAGL